MGNIDFDVNANQPVAMIFDDIALENNTLRSLPLFDIERIEVLKGPQGSLFGRNTNAGVIKIDSVKPSDQRNAYARPVLWLAGDAGRRSGQQLLRADTLAARASLKYQERGKWIDNTANGSGDHFGAFDELAWRLQFQWDPSDTFSGSLKLHGFNQDGSDPNVFHANALTVGKPGFGPVSTRKSPARTAATSRRWSLTTSAVR